jgi:hypothetical protein
MTSSAVYGDLRSGEVRSLAPECFGVKDPRTTWSRRQYMVDQFQLPLMIRLCGNADT